jgi:hypothetical protein
LGNSIFQEHNGSQEQKISPQRTLVNGHEQEGWPGMGVMEISLSLLFVHKQRLVCFPSNYTQCMWAENGRVSWGRVLEIKLRTLYRLTSTSSPANGVFREC